MIAVETYLPVAYTATLVLVRCFVMLFVIQEVRTFLRGTGMLVVSALLTAALYPHWSGHALAVDVSSDMYFGVALFREVTIGLLLGFPLSIALLAYRIAARLVDLSRGAQIAEQMYRGVGDRTSVLETAVLLLISVLVVSFGGYHVVVLALADSLGSEALQVGNISAASQLSVIGGSTALIAMVGAAISAGVILAAPVLIVCFCIDLGGALASRVLRQINVSFEILPLKLLIGLATALLVMDQHPFFPQLVQDALRFQRSFIG